MIEDQFIKIQRLRRTGNIEEYFSWVILIVSGDLKVNLSNDKWKLNNIYINEGKRR